VGAEDEHADCQHHCANMGQIDEPVWGPSVGRHDGQEKGRRNQDCGDRDRTSHNSKTKGAAASSDTFRLLRHHFSVTALDTLADFLT
jgi:hypothetical protein